jgi:hypothetical protein
MDTYVLTVALQIILRPVVVRVKQGGISKKKTKKQSSSSKRMEIPEYFMLCTYVLPEASGVHTYLLVRCDVLGLA